MSEENGAASLAVTGQFLKTSDVGLAEKFRCAVE